MPYDLRGAFDPRCDPSKEIYVIPFGEQKLCFSLFRVARERAARLWLLHTLVSIRDVKPIPSTKTIRDRHPAQPSPVITIGNCFHDL